MDIRTLLVIIAVLLFMILLQLDAIRARLKGRFPTEQEQDFEWAKKDPMGHWEAHKGDKK